VWVSALHHGVLHSWSVAIPASRLVANPFNVTPSDKRYSLNSSILRHVPGFGTKMWKGISRTKTQCAFHRLLYSHRYIASLPGQRYISDSSRSEIYSVPVGILSSSDPPHSHSTAQWNSTALPWNGDKKCSELSMKLISLWTRFANSEEATISFVMSVRLEQLDSHLTDFYEIWYLSIFQKLRRGNSSLTNIWKEQQVLDIKTYVHLPIISRWILLRIRNVWGKSCRISKHINVNVEFTLE
jgi:hypothetical protein